MISNSLITAATITPNSLQLPNSWVGHLPFAAWLIQEISPTIFVELGIHSGNSYFSFCQAVVEAKLTTKCYAVDSWQGDEHAGQYNEEMFAKVNTYHQEHYAGFSRLLRMTFDDAATYFTDESIELLHIDGLHIYEAIRHDFETWLPKLAPGAVVMFHDTNVRESNFGVWKLWNELQADYPNNLEFVHSHGLGVLQLNNTPDNKKLEWLQSDSPAKQRLVNYFAALGARQLERFQLNELKQHTSNLNQAITKRDKQIANFNQGIAERDAYIRKLVSSKSWLITKPILWASRIVRGDFIIAIEPIKRALHINNSADLSSQVTTDLRAHQCTGSFVTASPIKPTHPVAVILPVYRGVEMTKRCILAAMPGILAIPDSRIIVINDASPDIGMQEMLEQLAAQWPTVFVVQKNEKNLGFVCTVNRGFAYFSQHDAVLLNSDVIVPKDWLSRLIDEAYSTANIGTVTPFSNNATICSFPHFLQENSQPFNLEVDSIDAVFRCAKLPCVEAPTGVGFCIYIRRTCLEEIGYFNEEKFGRGYGEENDFCQRALKLGWLNIISPNIYAYHEGGVSFSSDKQALINRAMKVIEELHPNYHADVLSFIKHDPLKVARVARYIQLLSTTAIPKVLHVSHAIGGGVGQHIEELVQYFEQRIAHILLAPNVENGSNVISFGISQHADKIVFYMPEEYADMLELLKDMGISAVHFHHTVGLDSKILDLPHDLGVTHILTVHDFYWLNGNPTLTDKNGKYPGYYSDTLINPLYPLPEGLTPETFRAPLHQLIESAACVIFPSIATKSLFGKVFPLENAIVAPHIEMERDVTKKPIFFKKKNNYTIGVLGAVSREKGADLLENLAVTAKNAGVPFGFKLLGYAYRPLKVVEVTGPYSSNDLIDLIQRHELDVIFFPAQWPETYSYTLSYALDSGLPIIAPNIGAFPERLSGRANTMLFNHLSPDVELIKLITAFIEKLAAGRVAKASKFKDTQSKHNFYDRTYSEIVARDLKVADPNQTTPYLPNLVRLIKQSEVHITGWREALLAIIWRLYMQPSMQWVGRFIPFSVRRSVKRHLSVRPMHDILKITDSKKLW
ncbi:MAG: class I SAM-dependent methyltransferase [Methylococcaceae bacterium]|jgi:GT2 family glycosyltransferase